MNIKKYSIIAIVMFSLATHAAHELGTMPSSMISDEDLQKKISDAKAHILQLVRTDPSKLPKAQADFKALKALLEKRNEVHKAHVQIRFINKEISTLSAQISRNKKELAPLLNIQALEEELKQYRAEEEMIAALPANERAKINQKDIGELTDKIHKTETELGERNADQARINILENTIKSTEQEIASLRKEMEQHKATIKDANNNREIGE